MAPRDAFHDSESKVFPPMHQIKRPQRVSDSTAEPILARFLASSAKKENAFLHPDCYLASHGITHGPRSGPSGGITMHYLRRIEAGMRGENLAVETREDLVAQFGEDVFGDSRALAGANHAAGAEGSKGETTGASANAEDELPAGDDSRLDAAISLHESNHKGIQQQEKDHKAARKAAKKARRAQEKLQMAQSGLTDLKRKHDDSAAGKDANDAKDDGTSNNDWQSKELFDQTRTVLEGEVGGRHNAPVVRQNGAPPLIAKHGGSKSLQVGGDQPKVKTTKKAKLAGAISVKDSGKTGS